MRISKGIASIKFQRQEHAWGSSRNGNEIHVAKAQGMKSGAIIRKQEEEWGKLAGSGFKAIENLHSV